MKKTSLLSVLIILLLVNIAWAGSITQQEARRAALAWLNTCPKFVNNEQSIKYSPAKKMHVIRDQLGKQTIAYVMELQPTGFIIVTPNDELNPIIAYSEKSKFDASETPQNTLLHLLRSDVADRILALANNEILPADRTKAHATWESYLNMVDIQGQIQIEGATKTTYDVEHGPFLTSQWSQSNAYDDASNYNAVWNYYTPKGPDGSTSNYVCGCVATAMAQILNYYEWPITGTGSYSYTWDNGTDPAQVLSADFGATTYDWANILDIYRYVPSTLTQRQKVGQLTYHCGVSVDMNYTSSGSGAYCSSVANSFGNYFRHSGEYVDNSGDFYDRLYNNMLDHRPGELSISNDDGGHAVVVDGVRHDAGDTKYYHLNMGWGGADDAWYDLPNVTTPSGNPDYDTVNGAVLDIVPTPDMNDPGDNIVGPTLEVSWEVSDKIDAHHYELQQAVITNTSGNLIDNAESGTGNWEIDGYWEPSTHYSTSGSYSFHGDIYNGSVWRYPGYFTLDKVVKVGASTTITYYYWLRDFINYEARFDVSEDGNSWTALKTYTSTVDVGPVSETVSTGDLSSYVGKIVFLRFVIDYLGGSVSYGSAGVYIDDFSLNNAGFADWTVVDDNITTTSKTLTLTQAGYHCYRVRANCSQWYDWSDVEVGEVDNPIPVELTAFNVTSRNGAVDLQWVTQSETENLGFHVYRSMAEQGDYEQVSTQLIQGAGNSIQAHTYNFTDTEIEHGNTYYYKLADVTFAGYQTYHGPVSVNVESLPTKYTLEQGHPNPFNPVTAINFSIKETGKVSLNIYNLQGQLVRTLVDEDKFAGTYSIMWNGTNDQGVIVTSGTYLYTLKVNGFEATKKLVFMK